MLILSSTIILIIGISSFLKRKILLINSSDSISETKFKRASSLPAHYKYCFIIWSIIFCSLPIFLIQDNNLLKISILLSLLATFLLLTIFLVKKRFNAKRHLENFTKTILTIATTVGIIITFLITISILFEAIKFFKIVPIIEFIFGTSWNPQIAMTSEQGVSKGSFGMIPIFTGTLLITTIAITISAPLGLFAAIYLSEYATVKTRNILKPILEVLAGIPTVVYGYFAVTAIAPTLRNIFANFGIEVASESALSAGLVMGVMIIPFILSLSDDAINAVPAALKNGALAMGSTKSEMIRKVVLISAFPGIMSSILLAISRAIGETMIVVMAAGLVANLTFNPLDSVTTATTQIVTLLVGDQSADSPKTLAAFALGLVLFCMTLIFNIIALVTVKKYKEKYR